MLLVFDSLLQDHDPRLVTVAAVICYLAAFTALATFSQARGGRGSRPLWVALSAFVSGTGIWATHFVAMLAHQPGIPMYYDVTITIASIVAALAISGCGWTCALQGGRLAALLGGALIGFGIGVMHYLGMSAAQLAGHVTWDGRIVVLSLVIGTLLSAVALHSDSRRPGQLPWRAAALLTLAICGLHFTGMKAAMFHHSGGSHIPATGIGSDMLAVLVAASAVLILAVSFAVVLFDRSLARKEIEEAKRLSALADEVLRAAGERERLTAELERQVEISSAALNNMAQGLSLYDENDRLITSNRRYAEIYGTPAELLRPGTPIEKLLAYQATLGNMTSTESDTIRSAIVPAGMHEVTLHDGTIIEIQRRFLPGGGWVATHEDVTERRRASERIAYLASHDPLTNLPNRTSFGEQLGLACARVKLGHSFALHTIDLDRFKEVNDTLGHPVGDQILKQVAVRLCDAVRTRDTVTRLGGDEFAVIQADLQHPSDAAALATRIIESLSEPIQFDGHSFAVGASIGISMAPEDGTDAEGLLKKSDLALYRAKADSRGTFRFFEAGMDARLVERRQIETDLRSAIRHGEFELHYQPTLDLVSQAVTGCEALIRWRHPTRGLLQPADFISTAEESGLIIPIGEWVLREACREAAKWPAHVRVAVNLSAAQFKRGDLLAVVESALANARLAPSRLELEVTETTLLNDEAWVRTVLTRMRELGLHIAMDDFGTGYSSLSYLRSFPFSRIKIDRSFVADIASSKDSLAIVQATLQLASKLGLSTTGEGVETPEQMRLLGLEGCAEVQGYHVSRPVPAREVGALLARFAPPRLRAAS